MLSLLLSLLRTIGKSLVYGSVFVLITGAFFTYAAWPNDGLFGQYFHNIVNTACSDSDGIVTGFSTTQDSTYGSRICKSFKAFLGENNIYPVGGNLGIGTNNPIYKLDVNGDILARNNMAAQVFYDGNDGTYYVNPNGNSYMSGIYAKQLCLPDRAGWSCLSNWRSLFGACGSADGATTTSYPTTNQCSGGTPIIVDNVGSDGVYNWSCAGITSMVNCSAPRGGASWHCSANYPYSSVHAVNPMFTCPYSGTPTLGSSCTYNSWMSGGNNTMQCVYSCSYGY